MDSVNLTKVTLSYCPSQDRVRMDALATPNRTIRFWFTARLLSLLIGHLVKTEQFRESCDATPQARGDRGESGQAPVAVIDGSQEVLVSAVDVSTAHDLLQLVYKDVSGNVGGVHRLSSRSLREFMAGLRQCCESAQWPMAVLLEKGGDGSGLAVENAATIH